MLSTVKKIIFLSIALLITHLNSATAQDKTTDAEVKKYEKEIVDLVKYVEGTFNFLGSTDAPASEKEIVISESYSKVFRDSEVQIEDDLDEARETPMNKNVQSYLQDIDFFFSEAKFTLDIQSITKGTNERNEPYFTVTLNRNLKATDIKGNAINNNKPRYIEIALNEEARDLKIISFYTTKLDETADLRFWWDNLPVAWQTVLSKKINITAKPSDTQIKNILKITEIDISGNKEITDLLPLSRLTSLQKVNCANTKVNNVDGLRNLIKLESLDCSNTQITSFDALKYTTNLRIVLFNNTLVSDINQFASFLYLQQVQMNKTLVKDLTPLEWAEELIDIRFNETGVASIEILKELTNIESFHASTSKITDISTLSKFTKLRVVDISNTTISDISSLAGLPALEKIVVDNTAISEINSLSGMKTLTRIYCDNTKIKKEQASAFMQKNPQTLVMYDSQILFTWWKEMPEVWKTFFLKSINFSGEPGKEELQLMANINSIDLQGNKEIKTLDPLSKMNKLEILNVSETSISDLTPLIGLLDLKEIKIAKTSVSVLNPILKLSKLQKLDISNTSVSELLPLKGLTSLEELIMDNTKVSSISILDEHKSLKVVYADKTGINEEIVDVFNAKQPECLVIYQTEAINTWWNKLDKTWKAYFQKEFQIQDKPDREQAHKLLQTKELSFAGDEFKTIEPLEKLKSLEVLNFTDTRITDLKPISKHKNLRVLKMAQNPGITDLSALKDYSRLEGLDIQNTLVKDLSPISTVTSLKILKLNGTNVNTLKSLAGLANLEQLEFFNTKVWFLKPLFSLKKLEKVKFYNTKVLKMFTKKYMEANPSVDVVSF